MKTNNISAKEVAELLNYDPKTGVFTWIKTRGSVKAGTVAGSMSVQGYRIIRINGKDYKAHRLAWLLTYGEMPELDLDHVNGERADNRLKNLRQATPGQNMGNSKRMSRNTSGIKGVSWRSKSKKWAVYIHHGQRNVNIGSFNTLEEAAAAYKGAAKICFGPFACYDR